MARWAAPGVPREHHANLKWVPSGSRGGFGGSLGTPMGCHVGLKGSLCFLGGWGAVSLCGEGGIIGEKKQKIIINLEN